MITFPDKETFQALPDVPENQKVTAANINHMKTVINSLFNFIEVTYAQAAALIADGGLIPNRHYKLTDRGDLGIFLQAISPTGFAKWGTRIMLCPADYIESGESIGVWNPYKSVSLGQRCIWGGLVWENTSGSMGNPNNDSSMDSNWAVIAKDAAPEGIYIPMVFGCMFDFANDWIEKQWDGHGNVFGISFAMEAGIYGFGFNPVDVSDWNYRSITEYFYSNQCVGVWNNSNNSVICENISQRGIIAKNICPSIIGNICHDGITDNRSGGIDYNRVLFIKQNQNSSHITYNIMREGIYANSNTGFISGNTCYRISENTNVGDIDGNTNRGSILGNNNGGSIQYNSNNGNIEGCGNLGLIEYNTNNGNISYISGDTVAIRYNNNNGVINVTVVGDITETIVDK